MKSKQNINKEIQTIKQKGPHTKSIPRAKKCNTKMKNLMESFKHRLSHEEERISALNDRILEITQLEQRREIREGKRVKKAYRTDGT